MSDDDFGPMLGPEPPAEPKKTRKAKPPASAPVKPLNALAATHGHVARPAPDGDNFSAAHMCAAVRHAWNWHEHHFGGVELSDDDYLAALDAASKGGMHPPANRSHRL